MDRTHGFERWPRATLVATAMALLLACDLLAGALLPRPGVTAARLGGIRRDGARRYDARYHHGFGPGVRFRERWGGPDETYPIVTNQLGLRDADEREVPAYTPKRRILFLGDSFVEGIGVPYEETFVGIVDRRLGRERFDVLDAGVSGASPKLYFYKLKFLLEDAGLKVDDLYVFIDTSDAHNEIEFEDWEPGTPPYREPPRPGRTWETLRRWSYLADLAWQGVVRWRERDRVAAARRLDDEMYEMFDPEVQARWGRRALGHLDDYVQRLLDLCKDHGIRANLVIFPHPFHIEVGTRAAKWSGFWRRVAERNQVPLLDLFPLFVGQEEGEAAAQRRAVAERFFIPGDIHWNAAGHELVAEQILHELSPRGAP
jgi:lysophospholipase L1-like esterase